MSEVKIVAVSDLHGCASFDRVADIAIRNHADIVVVAGDIQTAYRFRSPRDAFHDDFLNPVKRLGKVGIEVVITPGNHDSYLKECLGSDNRKRFLSNLHILCDRSEKILGLKFYGTPWVPFINGQWVYEKTDELLYAHFSHIPADVDVLIAHSPPAGKEDSSENWDVSCQFKPEFREHYGSVPLRKEIETKKPRCVICGHIHSGDHRLYRLGDSALINVSMVDERYEKAFDPAEIVFRESGTMSFKTSGVKKWKNLKITSKKCAS